MLADQRGLDALFHQPLARSSNRVDAGLQSCGDLAVTPCFASVRGVGFQQDTCLQQLARRVFALADQGANPLSLLIAEPYDVLLYKVGKTCWPLARC